jgi:serine/threonine protein kinase
MLRWLPSRGAAPNTAAGALACAAARETHPRWGFEEGHEIAPGRHVLKRLGGGSRYEVYLAWDETLFALVVAKLLRPDQVGAPRALRELRRESELLERLAHPCLVRGLGAVLDGPHPHVLLEHVEGPTLQQAIAREGPLALDQLLPLALHLLAVLHYLSGRGYVHLDLKPANVVMSAPPRVIDLSIARPAAEACALRSTIGTDAYMAPEQCDRNEGAPPLWPAADVWGAGATLHHAIAGEVPFPRPAGADASGVIAERFPQLHAPPAPLPATVPAALAGLVARMLARDPAKRPSPREAAEALEPLVAEVPDRLVRSRRRGLVPPR